MMMKTLRGAKLYLVEKYCFRVHVGNFASCEKCFPQGMTLEGKLLSLFLLLLLIQNTLMHVCVCVFVYVCVCVCCICVYNYVSILTQPFPACVGVWC